MLAHGFVQFVSEMRLIDMEMTDAIQPTLGVVVLGWAVEQFVQFCDLKVDVGSLNSHFFFVV
jgi:hypothetical protein